MFKIILSKIKKGDVSIYISVVFLIIFGSIMVGSATIGNAALSSHGGVDAVRTVSKQLAFIFIGLVSFVLSVSLYRHLLLEKKRWIILYVLGIGLLIACKFYEPVNGAQAWLHFGIFTFQPSELCKVMLILVLSVLLTDFPEKYSVKPMSLVRDKYISKHPRASKRKVAMECKKYHRNDVIRFYFMGVFIPLVILGIELFIVKSVQNDTGTAVITLLICSACIFVTNSKYYERVHRLFVLLLGVGFVLLLVCGLFYLIFSYAGFITYLSEKFNVNINLLQTYQKSRFSSWLNPLGDVFGTSAQLVNSLIAIAKGGLFGVGIFDSRQKFGYIPEVETDFITSLIFEELGLIGLACIVIPYAIIVFRLFYIAMKMDNPKSRLILVGISSMFFVHLFINLGGVSGLIPMTGIPLIFISQGGTSVMTGSIAIGICQAIIGREYKGKDPVKEFFERIRIRITGKKDPKKR